MKIAVVPGSFDPVTKGHIDIVKRTADMFDIVYVVAIINEDKKYPFSLLEREEMVQGALKHTDHVKLEIRKGRRDAAVKATMEAAIVNGIRVDKDRVELSDVCG